MINKGRASVFPRLETNKEKWMWTLYWILEHKKDNLKHLNMVFR